MKNKPIELEKVLKKAVRDLVFRKNLLLNPEAVLKAEEIALPDGASVKIVENTSTTVHLILPPLQSDEAVSDEALEDVNGGTQGCTVTYNMH